MINLYKLGHVTYIIWQHALLLNIMFLRFIFVIAGNCSPQPPQLCNNLCIMLYKLHNGSITIYIEHVGKKFGFPVFSITNIVLS